VAWFGLNALGYRSLVEMSGSMQPAIAAGDVVVTKTVPPRLARVGDVVSFRDPSRGQKLVTHRVTAVRATGSEFAFMTKGDSNTGTEQWTIGASGTIGRLSLRVPYAGIVLVWLGHPKVRAALLMASFLVLCAVAVRLILRTRGSVISRAAVLVVAASISLVVGARGLPATFSAYSSTRSNAEHLSGGVELLPVRQHANAVRLGGCLRAP
jgi:signal peptidase I